MFNKLILLLAVSLFVNNSTLNAEGCCYYAPTRDPRLSDARGVAYLESLSTVKLCTTILVGSAAVVLIAIALKDTSCNGSHGHHHGHHD
jgi:hypothetical protein